MIVSNAITFDAVGDDPDQVEAEARLAVARLATTASRSTKEGQAQASPTQAPIGANTASTGTATRHRRAGPGEAPPTPGAHRQQQRARHERDPPQHPREHVPAARVASTSRVIQRQQAPRRGR